MNKLSFKDKGDILDVRSSRFTRMQIGWTSKIIHCYSKSWPPLLTYAKSEFRQYSISIFNSDKYRNFPKTKERLASVGTVKLFIYFILF